VFFHRENASSFSPDQLNATDVRKYFAEQDADKSVKPASRNRRLASLRVLVHWAAEVGLLEYDPTISIKRQPVEPSPRDRSGSEMERLSAVIGAGSHLKCQSENHVWLGLRDRVIWILFNSAGLRISEVIGLDVTDLDFSANEINVLGKGAKKATVKMSAEAMNEVAEWLRTRGVNSDAVITDWHGKRITTGQARVRVKMVGAAAEVNDLKPHDLRHTYAFALSDALKKQGLPESAITNGVRKQLRHADEKTTRLYFGVRDSQIRAALEVM
jgi:integrase/recombinase XerC